MRPGDPHPPEPEHGSKRPCPWLAQGQAPAAGRWEALDDVTLPGSVLGKGAIGRARLVQTRQLTGGENPPGERGQSLSPVPEEEALPSRAHAPPTSFPRPFQRKSQS